MITNRPLVPRELQYGDVYRGNCQIYDYFAETNITQDPPNPERTNHGLDKRFLTKQGEWEQVLNIVGNPGMCTFMAVAAVNTHPSNVRWFGIRVFIDGAAILSEERYPISAANGQSGLCIVGNLFNGDHANSSMLDEVAAAQMWVPFDRSLQAYMYTDNISNVSGVLALDWYMTV